MLRYKSPLKRIAYPTSPVTVSSALLALAPDEQALFP